MPVVLAGLEEHAVARPDHLYRPAATLAEADALGDVDGLPEGVGVPGGAGAGREVDAGGPEGEGSEGSATVSMQTMPVKYSLGPVAVSVLLLLVICIVLLSLVSFARLITGKMCSCA